MTNGPAYNPFRDPLLWNPYRETPGTVITVKAPWYDSMPVGVPSGDFQTTNLTQGYVYLHYSAPIGDPVELHGFNINFTPVDVRVLLANELEKDSWSPFVHVPLFALTGLLSQAEPVWRLPRPIKIRPFSRIQVIIVNWGETLSNCVLTFAGVREVQQLICF
jgi:hypothetical protein